MTSKTCKKLCKDLAGLEIVGFGRSRNREPPLTTMPLQQPKSASRPAPQLCSLLKSMPQFETRAGKDVHTFGRERNSQTDRLRDRQTTIIKFFSTCAGTVFSRDDRLHPQLILHYAV